MRPRDGLTLIWLMKATLRAGEPLPPRPFAYIDKASPTGSVLSAFMSDDDSAHFISGVKAGAGFVATGRRDAQCETGLFLGEWLLMRKKPGEARASLMEAEAACQPLTLERATATATAELARLPQ